MPRPVGRRADILNAFIRHVAERGYNGTNMGDIANELGMSKGTIVHHFGTKAQMLRELEEAQLTRQRDVVRMLWDRLESPQERIASVVQLSVLMLAHERDATVASQREAVQLTDDPAMQEVRKLRSELQALVVDEIRNGVEAGVFRSVDVELSAVLLWAMVQGMWVWFDPGGSRTPEEVGAAMVDNFVGGLLLDRLGLAKWADPGGHVVTAVRECLAAAGDSMS